MPRAPEIMLNEIMYLLRRNSWMLDPSWFLQFYHETQIDRPIFILGNQGGGLTLISRILRRNHDVVSITGNANYWSGADEMQNVMGPLLPPELTGLRHKAPYHPLLTAPRSWSYASNALIQKYRNTEEDFTPDMEYIFKSIIKYTLWRYSLTNSSRFIDKSQVFTVKLSLINRLLHENAPKFVLVTRNPYIECPRAAIGKAGDMKRYASYLSWNERLDYCTQHWQNSFQSVLDDIDKYKIKVKLIRFEDFLENPKKTIKGLCKFIELEYDPKMLPQKDDSIPFGSHYRDRWYPLRKGVNEKYKSQFKDKDFMSVEAGCGKMADQLGYKGPFEISQTYFEL